jgi:hypothetical protein
MTPHAARFAPWMLVALVTIPSPSSAQGRRPFEDLGRYLKPGDTVFVVERAEGASEGTVSGVTPAEIVVSVSNGERRLTRDTVAWIEKSPDSVKDGAALGAILGLPMGLLSAALNGGEVLPFFVAGAAAIGAAADAADKGRQFVYGGRPGVSFMRRPLPVSSLGDLWSRVPPGDPIRVRDASSIGEREGKFVKASPDALTMEVDSGEVVVPVDRIQLVERRSYVPGHWIGIGMVVGGVAGYFKRHDEYNRHATREDVGKIALLGGLAGFLYSGARARYTDVYRPQTAAGLDVAASAVVVRGRRGAAVTIRF